VLAGGKARDQGTLIKLLPGGESHSKGLRGKGDMRSEYVRGDARCMRGKKGKSIQNESRAGYPDPEGERAFPIKIRRGKKKRPPAGLEGGLRVRRVSLEKRGGTWTLRDGGQRKRSEAGDFIWRKKEEGKLANKRNSIVTEARDDQKGSRSTRRRKKTKLQPR